ncbi:MAG TPA: choice-of-anchor D domain-containing protein, partial [Bacteroidia bacterium]
MKTRTTTSAEFGGGGIHTFDFDGDGKAELLYLDTVFKIAFNTSVKDSIMKSNAYRFNTVFDGNYNVRDLNLDGKLDIIANRRLNGNENELVFFRNTSTKGNLSFVTSLDTFPVELSYAKMEVTDFNGDLLPDLAFVGGYFVNDTIDFYTNLSDANNIRFGNNARFRVPGSEILSKHTDFNNDGKTDLLISTDSGVYVLINKSISGYLSRTLYSGSSLFGTPLSLDLVIYSDGGDTLKIDRINLPPGFSLSNSSGLLRFGLGTGISFPILIAPGDSFVLQIENDSLLAPGKYTDEVELFNNAKNKPFVLKIQRDILASPVAHLNKTTLNFGDREYNSAAIDSLVLKNTGNDTLKIASILLSDSTNFKLLSINPNVLLPNDSVWIKVKFLSQKTGSYFENIWIKNNSHDTLVGVVLEAQTVRPVLPDSVVIDMGTVKKGTKKTVFYELVNTGKDSLEMNSPISFSGSMFNMSQVDLSKTFVKTGDSVRLKIEFDATVFGLQNEEYQYNYVSGNFKTKFVFKGWSIGSNLQLSSKQIELGNIRKGKKRNYRIQFSNTGNQTLVIRSLDASNSNWKVGVCDTNDSIQSNGNSEICLEIDPVVNGVLMDSIKIICNDLDSIHFIKVKAEVISAEPILVQQADTIKEFVGQYDKSVISIRNIGNDTMFNVLGSFANVSNVKVKIKNNLSNTILPGAQQDFDLYFHPLSIVNIKDNFKLESMYDTTLFSSGIQFVSYNGAFGDLDRNSIYARVNKTKDTVLKIKNIGNYKFKLSGLTNVSSQVNYLPIVNEVLPDDELAFNVKISPNVYSASIVDTLKLIAIVDSLPIQKNYPIHYYLLYPKIELSATGFDYGLVSKGSEAMKNLAVKNTGNDTLFYKLKMPAGFESNQGNDTILMAGQTKNLQIKFKPNQLKVYLDSIDVIANS